MGKNVMRTHMENYRKKNEDDDGNPIKPAKKRKDRGTERSDEDYSSDGSFDKQLLEEIKEVQWQFKKNLMDPKKLNN
jgi:hypothetical protein